MGFNSGFKGLRADWSQVMFPIIRWRTLCFPVCYQKKYIKIKIYGTIIPSVVVYGYETWSLTLREERRLRAFENRVLRRIFGPKRNEVTGEWRKLHNEQLNDLHSPPNFNYNRILVLQEFTLKIATRLAETCRWP